MSTLHSLTRLFLPSLLMFGSGCSGGDSATMDSGLAADSGPTAADAASEDASAADASATDASTLDAAADADTADANTTDAGPTSTYYFVMDHLQVPTNASSASALGVDLDSDGLVDNALGGLIGSLGSVAGIDFAGSQQDDIDSGSTIMLLKLETSSLVNAASATVTQYAGTNASPLPCLNPSDTICRRHLQGTASFDLAVDSPTAAIMTGPIASSGLSGSGQGYVEISLGDSAKLDLYGAKISATVASTSMINGSLAGGILKEDTENILLPKFHSGIVADIAADCSGSGAGCGCASGSSGESWIDFFDSNANCAVTLAEFTGNSLIQSTFLNPDLDLFDCATPSTPISQCTYSPNSDGVKDALSLGVGFTAVHASF